MPSLQLVLTFDSTLELQNFLNNVQLKEIKKEQEVRNDPGFTVATPSSTEVPTDKLAKSRGRKSRKMALDGSTFTARVEKDEVVVGVNLEGNEAELVVKQPVPLPMSETVEIPTHPDELKSFAKALFEKIINDRGLKVAKEILDMLEYARVKDIPDDQYPAFVELCQDQKLLEELTARFAVQS